MNKESNHIDDAIFNIIKKKHNFLSHGAYVKDLETINEEKWVQITVTTTS